ncbi:MAG TPA: hypothetical protein VFT78_12970 [Hanamia sp.]|nr:hypothetical protein [Hanamia sp.]
MQEKTIISESGNIIFIDTQADISDKERRLIDVINGAKPRNEEEEKMVREIKDIEQRGGSVEIPFD